MQPRAIPDVLLILFTGLRRTEAARLRWSNVDLKARTLLIPSEETKNHQRHPLPLSDYLLERLQARPRLSEYVFPVPGGAGYLVEPRRAMEQVRRTSGVQFTLHDLRRRFLPTADSLDIPHYALKRLANHRDSSDATAGYIVADVERLREPMQTISVFLAQLIGIEV
ncbi:MAG TPA: tyrosine-type recombinase/integrase [Candidatus Obscuribacterales bacterium]